MNTRVFERKDFAMGLQNASSWRLRQPNEIDDGRNLRFNKEIGAAVRRNGYIPLTDAFSASGKDPVGWHVAQFTTGSRRMVAVPAEDNSATLVKVQETNGSWTTIINDLPIGVDVHFTDYRDEVYVTGYTIANDTPFQPRNIDKTLDVSLTRNLLFAPYAKYFVVYRGILYAANVRVGSTNYPDRVYKSSAPTGAITFIRSTQIAASLKVDSTRYLKVGMAIDIYKRESTTKIYDLTIADVNKTDNIISFAAVTASVTSANVNTTTDVLTSTAAHGFATGAPVVLTAGGTAPTGLVTGATYYAINVTSTTFKLATSAANALAGTAIDITAAGSGTNTFTLNYSVSDNDEIYLDGRQAVLSTLWNTDYPTPDKADWTAVQPGTDSSNAITGVHENGNRLFVFTLNSGNKFDGNTMINFSKSIGCVSHRSIQSIDDDWMVWLTPRARVYARNEAAGQQEYISRGMFNKFFSKLTLAQMKASAAGSTDNEYTVYVGVVDGEPSRAVYDFGSNTWSIDALGHPTLMYANDVISGVIKPLFLSDDGKMYQDDTGNSDAEKVTRFQMDLGKTSHGTNREKIFEGHYIYSDNAIGLKVVIRVDGGDPIVIGEITADYGDILYKIDSNSKKKFMGTTLEVSLKGAVAGPPQAIYGVDDYFNIVQEINANAKKQ